MTIYKLTTLASFADVELAWTDHSMQLLAIHHDDDMDELVTYDDYLNMRKEDNALFGKTVHIEHVNDLGWDSVEAYCNENKEGDDAFTDEVKITLRLRDVLTAAKRQHEETERLNRA